MSSYCIIDLVYFGQLTSQSLESTPTAIGAQCVWLYTRNTPNTSKEYFQLEV